MTPPQVVGVELGPLAQQKGGEPADSLRRQLCRPCVFRCL